jgi:hypothetical protein
VGAIKAAWIGAFAIALVTPASAGWALPNPPALAPAVAAATGPLLVIRHHHGHWRHRHSRWPGDDEPEAAAPGTDQPGAAVAPPVTAARPPPTAPSRATRGSGSSAPAIRWVDPEKPVR